MHFKTKTHLLAELREICNLKELSQFAQIVASDSLNKAKIKTKGTTEEILESLLKAPKSVLESTFDLCFEEENEAQGYEPNHDDGLEEYESEYDDAELDEDEDN